MHRDRDDRTVSDQLGPPSCSDSSEKSVFIARVVRKRETAPYQNKASEAARTQDPVPKTMEGNSGAEREQVALQQPGLSDLGSSASAGQRQGGRDEQSWGRLDQGILPLIASRLQEKGQKNLGPARLVCRQWAAELPEGCTTLSVQGMGPAGWELRFCGLEELNWWQPETAAGPSWPKLRSLSLTSCRGGDLGMLRNVSALTFLGLTSYDITDAGLKDLRNMPNLASLDLSLCIYITDEGLKELGGLSCLTSLRLVSCDGITDEGLKGLGHMPNLTSLNLPSCSKVTDAVLKDLGHMTKLTSLDLRLCFKITDAGLKGLRDMPNLTSLDLSYCSKITDAGLKDLGHMPNLSSLNLSSDWCITDAGLKHLGRMPKLISLRVSGCHKITAAGLKDLGHLSTLTSLSLARCSKITDAGLEELVHMSALASVNLSDCIKITAAGLKHLGHMPNLASLDLSGCSEVTNGGLQELKELNSSLTFLNL